MGSGHSLSIPTSTLSGGQHEVPRQPVRPLSALLPGEGPASGRGCQPPGRLGRRPLLALRGLFSCEGQAYGYFADVENNCEVFHICYPLTDDTGRITEYIRWSFFCGNGTVFDQEALVCNHPEDAFPCEESPSLYGDVQFGLVDDGDDYY